MLSAMGKGRVHVAPESPGGMKTWKGLRYLWDRLRDPARDLEFDRVWGVHTCGRIAPDKSDVVGTNWRYGAEYQGSNASALEEVLRELTIPYDQFTFLDLGSGKGRALLVAARFPFRRVLGVEYSAPLHAIAERNLSHFPAVAMRCHEIAAIHADAASVPLPDGPLVLFLFNPFERPVMTAVVNQVVTGLHQHMRRVLVLYSNPVCGDVWKKARFFEEVPSARKWLAIYETRLPDARNSSI
jgi:SAM-dependent methyltransferase